MSLNELTKEELVEVINQGVSKAIRENCSNIKNKRQAPPLTIPPLPKSGLSAKSYIEQTMSEPRS